MRTRWIGLAGAAAISLVAIVVAALTFAGGEEAAGFFEASDLAPGRIVTVVGSGELGLEGVGGPAREAQLRNPVDLAFDGEGNLYIAERFHHRILKVDRSGMLTVLAGRPGDRWSFNSGFSGDGGPATEAELNGASAVATGPDGSVYIADTLNYRVRKVDPDGIITTVAGTGEPGYSGDGGPATAAQLREPMGIAVGPDGSLYVNDVRNFAVRRIDPDGIITTVAGTGEQGSATEGSRAVDATLGSATDHTPMGLALDATGALHMTDLGNARIWKVDGDGRLVAVAGDGEWDFSGEDGPATAASIGQPLDIAFGPDGRLFIATHDHADTGHRVFVVDGDGTLTRVAGTGARGYSGDGGFARRAELNIPAAVEVGPDGNLYVADAVNNVVRMVALEKGAGQ